MDQHFVKKPSKSRLGGTKIEVWRALGQVWRRLGQSWAILDVCGSVLDRLGSVLEASWKPPGPFWAEKAGQHGSKMAPKTEAKSIKNNLKIDHLFDATWNHHVSVFLRFLESQTEPCWFENAFKNRFDLNKSSKPKMTIKPI